MILMIMNLINFYQNKYYDKNQKALKMIIINQISNLKEIYKDSEINESIYQEILGKIMYKYKNIT